MIRSMTAFATLERAFEGGALVAELRAVNHRFLELGLRLPEELRALEPALRERIASRIGRGKLDFALRLRAGESDGELKPNPRVVAQLSELALDFGARFPGLHTELGALLQFPGVLQNKAFDADMLQAEALALLDALARAHGLPFTAEDGRRLVAAIGWPQPYYLQLVFQTIRSRHRGGQPAGGLIDDAVDALVRPGEDNDFHHWEGRLKLQLSAEDAALATALLTLACREPQGATATALLAETQRRHPSLAEDRQTHEFCRLRDILIRDAYWVPDDGSGARRYRFPLEPLRRWWLRRHSL